LTARFDFSRGTLSSLGSRSLQRTVCMNAESSVRARGRLCTTLRFPRSPVLNKRSVAGRVISKASAPKLKHGAMAVRHWVILKGEIAFEQIGNGDRQRPWCSLAFANVPQRFTPQKLPKALK
jgi:hypothetical protein